MNLSQNGKHHLCPITRQQDGQNLIVGVVTYQEAYEERTAEQESAMEQPRKYLEEEEIAPPVVLLMNFARNQPEKKMGKFEEVSFSISLFAKCPRC